MGGAPGKLDEWSAAVPPVPDYSGWCVPIGVDVRSTFLQLALGAIDDARLADGFGPMVLGPMVVSDVLARSSLLSGGRSVPTCHRHRDTSTGDTGGTSMTIVLTVTDGLPGPFVYTWAQALANGAGGR